MSSENNGDDSRGRKRRPDHRIPLLKGRSNYLEWAQAMEIHLKAEQCWEIATGGQGRPPQSTYNQYTKPLSADELRELEPNVTYTANTATQRLALIEAEIKRSDAWDNKHLYAVETIFKTVQRHIWDGLQDQQNANNIWTTLEANYHKARVTEHVEELIKFHSIKPKDFPSTERYGEAVRASHLRLVNTLKFPFPSEHVAFKLLQELRTTFQIKLAQYDNAEVFPDYEKIIEDCVAHERQHGLIGTTKPTAKPVQSASVQVVSATEGSKRKRNLKPSEKPVCPECQKRHFLTNGICFTTHPEKAPEGWNFGKKTRPENRES